MYPSMFERHRKVFDFLASVEVFTALQSVRESEHRLQLALWASGEGIWEWTVVATGCG